MSRPRPQVISEYRTIRANGRRLRLLIVRPIKQRKNTTGVLWLHGGGLMWGTAEKLYLSRGIDLVTKCGAVVVSPDYTLSIEAPYPAAIRDCHAALVYLKDHAAELGVRSDQIMVGGESAGGGLTAALCMYAHDKRTVNIAFQMPLYPMLDCVDTPSSRDNHSRVWNTRKNHIAWGLYLRGIKSGEKVPSYASASRRRDYSGLPPCYTFVGSEEPFLRETMDYIRALRRCGIKAHADIFKGCVHAFDMNEPHSKNAEKAAGRFIEYFRRAQRTCFAEQYPSKIKNKGNAE